MQTSKKIAKLQDARPLAEQSSPATPKRRSKAKATVEHHIEGKRKIRKVSGTIVPPRADKVEHNSHPEDRERDQRLVRDLTANAGDNVSYRHREGLTGTENEEDGVPEDEDALDEAAKEEMDDEAAQEPRSGKPIDD